MADTDTRMRVKRIETEDGSYLDPPFDEQWPALQKLQWRAAVLDEDTGVDVEINEWPEGSGSFRLTAVKLDVTIEGLSHAWDFLNGMSAGAVVSTANGIGS